MAVALFRCSIDHSVRVPVNIFDTNLVRVRNHRDSTGGTLTAAVFERSRSLRNTLAHNAERAFWLIALSILAVTDPGAPPLIDLCVWKAVGLEACPGCGMGRGLAHLLDGHFGSAISSHPLSPFALVMIAGRIVRGNR